MIPPAAVFHKQQCVEWTSPQPRRTPTLFGVASLHRLPSSQIRCSSTWHRFADQQQSLRTSLHEPPRATLLHGRTAGPRTGQARQAQNRAAGCGGRQKAESRSAACARSSSTITAPLYCPTHSGNVHYVSTYRYKTYERSHAVSWRGYATGEFKLSSPAGGTRCRPAAAGAVRRPHTPRARRLKAQVPQVDICYYSVQKNPSRTRALPAARVPIWYTLSQEQQDPAVLLNTNQIHQIAELQALRLAPVIVRLHCAALHVTRPLVP